MQSLGRAGLFSDVVAATEDCLAFHSRYVDRRIIAPQDCSEEFLDRVKELDREHSYDIIIATTEASLLPLMRIPEGNDLRRRAVIPSNSGLEVALSKSQTLNLARQLGVPVPLSWKAELEKYEGKTFPIVVKPVHSRVSVDGELISLAPLIVCNERERTRVLKRLLPITEVVEQEYVAGVGIGIELLFEHGKKVWHFAHERVHELPLTGGASTYRRSIAVPPDALEFSEKLLGKLNWHGVAMVEFKRRPDGTFILMEVNPRLWGSVALAISSGVDFPRGLLALARGASAGPQPFYKVEHYSRVIPEDLIWMGVNFRADHQDKLMLCRPRLTTFLEPLRLFLGKESWDHFSFRDLGVVSGLAKRLYKTLGKYSGKALQRLANPIILRNHHRRVMSRFKKNRIQEPRILFLCYGNICRSPVAERLGWRLLPGSVVTSAGFHRHEYRHSPDHVLVSAEALGLDMTNHKSKRVTEEMLRQADVILLMDPENFVLLKEEFPSALDSATLLGLFSPAGLLAIKDPYELPIEETKAVLRQIESAILGLREWLKED